MACGIDPKLLIEDAMLCLEAGCIFIEGHLPNLVHEGRPHVVPGPPYVKGRPVTTKDNYPSGITHVPPVNTKMEGDE